MLDFEIIKKYYDLHLFNNERVAKFVLDGSITAGQYKEITGEEYTP